MEASARAGAEIVDNGRARAHETEGEAPAAVPRALVVPSAEQAPAPAQPIVDTSGRPAVSTRERAYRRALAGADVLASLLAFVLVQGAPGRGSTWLGVVLLPAGVVLGAKLYGLYDRDDLVLRKTTLEEAPRVFHLSLLALLGLWMAEDVVFQAPMTRTEAGLFAMALIAATLLARRGARAWCRGRTEAERCILIGDVRSYERLARKLEDICGARLVACLPLRDAHAGIDQHSGRVDALRTLIAGFDAHRVIIEPEEGQSAAFLDVVRGAKRVGVRVSVLPRVFDVVGASVERDEVDGLTLLGLRRFGLTRSSGLLKRALDVAGAALMLVVLSPLLALIALAIRLDTPGPVLFRQRRVGRGGEPFEIVKFRTMVADAEELKAELWGLNEADGLFKIAGDPRITRAGRLLRATSLDELPQLLNVLRGEMSLVGPRPLVGDEDCQVIGLDRRRLHLKPGMTGPWQIAGSARVPLTEMVKIDYRYVADWSLWNDLKILLRTVPFMLARRGL